MKRINDLTDEEVMALSEEELSRYADIECAEEGLPLLGDIPQPPTKPEHLPDTVVYKIGSIEFFKQEDAQKVEAVLATCDLCDVSYMGHRWNSNFRYAKKINSIPSITNEKVFSEELYRKRGAEMDSYIEKLNAYEKKESEYKKISERTNNIRSRVYGRVAECQNKKYEKERLKATYQKYLALANGDVTIAYRFFENAIPNMDLEFDHSMFIASMKPVAVDNEVAATFN